MRRAHHHQIGRTAAAAALCLAIAFGVIGSREASLDAQARGSVEGRVRLTGPAPANPLIRMGADPMCARMSRASGVRPVQQLVVRAADGGLANVFAEIQGVTGGGAAPSTPVTIDQKGCVYTPRVVGARVGQTLRVVNDDMLLHNVHALSSNGNEFNTSQPKSGMVFTYALKSEETMLRLKCDVHSWMTSYIAVVNHPYFGVSNEAGQFTIANVPPGRHMIRVWHERYGWLTKSVDVKAGAPTQVTFEYTGNEKPETAAVRELVLPTGTSTGALVAAR